ncbi:MAG: hypothetical protein E6R06_07515 [Mycobacterium sp.]|nr:MAG: hypothetical protein E6R06_07515 [Mycobacterium sp.]
MTSTETRPAPYVSALSVTDLFVDHSYQRPLDLPRSRRIAEAWDPPLIGIVEVSDRGEGATPRYALVDGQHRWAAAKLRDPHAHLVANIHTGLSVRDEARLFYEIDAKRTRLTGFDRWVARYGAGDPIVLSVHTVVEAAGLQIDPSPIDGNVRCVSSLEKIVRLGGQDLLTLTLDLIKEVWGVRLEAFDAVLVHGIALVLWHFGSAVDVERLGDALIDVAPRQIKARAVALREAQSGVMHKLAALVIVSVYNGTKGPKLKAPQDFTKKARTPTLAQAS